jgi:hypothetical protein
MKDISSNESLVIPDGVTVALKARTITVEGPRGKLVKNVGHVAMDLQIVSVDSEFGGATKAIGQSRQSLRWSGVESRMAGGRLGIYRQWVSHEHDTWAKSRGLGRERVWDVAECLSVVDPDGSSGKKVVEATAVLSVNRMTCLWHLSRANFGLSKYQAQRVPPLSPTRYRSCSGV